MQATQKTPATVMNILSKGKEKPITTEMILAVLAKLSQGNAEPLALSA